MQTAAVRLHGAYKLSMDRFKLPPITEDDALIRVISDLLSTSTYKAYKQGTAHKRVPENVEEVPVMVGHELCSQIVEIFKNLEEQICTFDGCINYFASPKDKGLMGSLDLYRIHYEGVHVVGTAGSTPNSMRDTIKLIEAGKTDPMLAELAKIVEAHNGLWRVEAEEDLLANAKKI